MKKLSRTLAGCAVLLCLATTPLTQAGTVSWDFHYLDSNFPDDAKQDLTAAGDIISKWLKTDSDVTVAIDVRGFNKKGGSLGNASSGKANIHTNFDRSVVQHKILSGNDANGSAADGEVNVNFNSSYKWGYGDEVPRTKMDFKAMVIHEFVHTLGFSGDIDPPDAAKTGEDRVTKWTEFDKFCSDQAGDLLVRTTDGYFQNGADDTEYDARAGLTGNKMRWAGPKGKKANANQWVPIFSPTPWSEGSSGSHLDDTVFEGKMMVSAGGGGGKEARNLSPVETGMMEDLGYVFQSQVQFSSSRKTLEESSSSSDAAVQTHSLFERSPYTRIGESRKGSSGAGTNVLWLTIVRTGLIETNGSVDYTTVPQSGKGKAEDGINYLSTSGTLEFASGVITQSFPISILSTTNAGSTVESVLLTLSNPRGGFTLGPVSNMIIQIVDQADGTRQSVLSETFSSSNLPFGWSVVTTNGNPGWAFDNPGDRPNLTGGSGGFGLADSLQAGEVNMDTCLMTPAMDLERFDYVNLEFDFDFLYETNASDAFEIEISTSGEEGPWETVWEAPNERYPIPSYTNDEDVTNAVIAPIRTGSFRGPDREILDISEYVWAETNVVIRFHYFDANSNGWMQLDNVRVFGNIDFEVVTNDVPGELPVWWQEIFFEGDPTNEPDVDADADGFSNYEEFIAGTDPMDAEYKLEMEDIELIESNSSQVISFWSEPGRTYTLGYSNRLTGAWVNLATNLHGDSDLLEYSHDFSGSAAYRLTVTSRGSTDEAQTIMTVTNIPGMASGLAATAGRYPNRILVSWEYVPGALFQVLRNVTNDQSSASSLGVVSATSLSDLDVGLYRVYYYWVQTCDTLSGEGTGYDGPVSGYATDVQLAIWNGLEIAWPTQAGTKYVVQWASELLPDNWVTITNVAGNGATNSLSPSHQSDPQGFYRVLVP
ncbi:MAG: hypothetical protein V2A34_13215 [Lentisphaerota bacterium]